MYRQCYRCHTPATQRAPQDPHPTDFGHRAAHTYLRHQTCPSRYLPNIVNRSADSVVRCAHGTLRARHVRCSLRGKQIARGRGPVGTSEYTRARRSRSPNTMRGIVGVGLAAGHPYRTMGTAVASVCTANERTNEDRAARALARRKTSSCGNLCFRIWIIFGFSTFLLRMSLAHARRRR